MRVPFARCIVSKLTKNIQLLNSGSKSLSSAAGNMLLYWGPGGTPSWRVKLTLEEKGIKGYQEKRVQFTVKDLKSEEILKLNPRGQVPAFRDGDVIVHESSAICLYLESKFKTQGTQLLPEDHGECARIMQRMFEMSNLSDSVGKGIAHVFFLHPNEKIDMEKMKPRYELARQELSRWEGYLAEQNGVYLTGDTFNMADVFFFPILAFMERCGLDFDKYPRMQKYYCHMKDRPSVQQTWPPTWKEKPGNQSILGPV